MDEIGEIMEYVQESAGSTDIILGACDDPSIGEKLSVTIIATGFESSRKPAYAEQKVVKVYELTDKPEVELSTEAAVTEEKSETEAVVAEEVPQQQEEVQIPVFTNDETFTLFDPILQDSDSANTIEFEVSREEQKLEEAEVTMEEENVIDETPVPTPSIIVEKKEEDYVIYTKKREETPFKDLYVPLNMPNYEISVVTLLNKERYALFDKNGVVIGESPLYEGTWSKARLSELLPVDYVPSDQPQ